MTHELIRHLSDVISIGRDLFDIFHALTRLLPDPASIIEAFRMYVGRQRLRISHADFEENLVQIMMDAGFRSDMSPILRPDIDYDIDQAFQLIICLYIPLLE